MFESMNIRNKIEIIFFCKKNILHTFKGKTIYFIFCLTAKSF